MPFLNNTIAMELLLLQRLDLKDTAMFMSKLLDIIFYMGWLLGSKYCYAGLCLQM